MNKIGERIKSRRLFLNMTQEEVAIKLGYKSKTTIAKIESGANDITQSRVLDFAYVLQTTPAYLMGLTGEKISKNKKTPTHGSEYEKFGRNLAVARSTLGLSQADIAKVFGIPQSTYAGYETGTRKIPLSVIIQLANYFGKSLDELISGKSSNSAFSAGGKYDMPVQDIINQRRLHLGLTLKDVATALGVSEGTISRYESGDIQNMGIDKIAKLAKVLQCSPCDLIGWTDGIFSDASNPFPLSKLEKELILKFRKLSDIERNMVLRMIGIDFPVSTSSVGEKFV